MPFDEVVAALNAAGDDAEALGPAIARAEAAGLDGVPGEDRQRLRGAGRAPSEGGGTSCLGQRARAPARRPFVDNGFHLGSGRAARGKPKQP
jgi:hypothetical protein